MSFHIHFFANDKSFSEKLSRDEKLLTQSITKYLESAKKRQEIIKHIKEGQCTKQELDFLSITLSDELALIYEEEQEERDITKELEEFSEHNAHFEHIRTTMNHYESKENYVYNLLKQLYDLLRDTAYTVTRLKKRVEENKSTEELVKILMEQINLEQRIVTEINKDRLEFHDFYKKLAQFTRHKYELEEHEQETANEIYERMADAKCFNPPSETTSQNQHHITELTDECFKVIEDGEFVQTVMNGQHTYVIYEFINSDKFVDMVTKNAVQLNMTSTEIKAFIIIFRDIYPRVVPPYIED